MNKQIRTIALNSALGSYLSGWDESKDPEAITKEINDAPGCYDWPEGIEVWGIYDSYSGVRLADLIYSSAGARMGNFLEVAYAIKEHIVTLATEDLMDLDQNQLDLRGWVESGFGHEMENDKRVKYEVGSSHGTLSINKWGFVVDRYLDCKCLRLDMTCPANIEWFDLAEFVEFWEEDLQDISHFDILDLGGRNTNGSTFLADPEFRKDANEGIKEDQTNG